MPEHVRNLIVRPRPNLRIGDLFFFTTIPRRSLEVFDLNGYVGGGLQKPDAFDQVVGGFVGVVATR
jgi:hypothetical protein